MQHIILVVHLLLAVALIGVVLLQKSEGGGLGIGGGGMSGLMTGRGTANLLTRTTAILAACFMVTSLALAWLATGASGQRSILETAPPVEQPAPPAETPAPEAPAPAGPSVPLAQ